MNLMPMNYILKILYFILMLFKKQLRENKKAHIYLAKWSLQRGPRVGIGHEIAFLDAKVKGGINANSAKQTDIG